MAEHGGSTYYAELEAGIEERLIRNRTENRLRHKKKADFEKTEEAMVRMQAQHQMNSGGFPYPEHHIKINNAHLSAREAAEQIVQAFGLSRSEGNEA